MLRRLTLALGVAALAVGVSSTAALATGPVTSTAGTASTASVSLSGWNLFLPVDSSGGTSGDAVTISPARLYSPWLTQDSTGALNFWAPANGATTPGSAHARTELRGTGTFVLGQGSAGLNETLKVTQLPDSSNQIIIGQMFASSGPFAHLHYQGGKIYGFIHGQSSEYDLLSGVPLGATFSGSITASGNTVKFSATYNGHTVTQTATGISSWIGQEMHFQAGDYQQDVPGSASTDGGRVSFSALAQYGVPGGTNPPPANDFSVTASPTSASVKAGSSATTTVSTAVTSGSAEPVTLSASGLPTGATATFNPASVNSGASSTLTIATGSTTPAGTYAVTVKGTASSGSHSTTYTLTVTSGSTPGNDFSVSASPTSGSVTAGASASTTIATAVTSGAAETVTLSASGLPTGATAAFSPASVSSGTSSTLKITTGSTTPAGTYTVTITGSAPSGNHTATYTLTVTTPSSSGCSSAWSSTASYVPGDKVSYGGHNYTALYWSTGVTPGSAIAWNIWQDDGAC